MNLKKKKTVLPLDGWPAWFDGKSINEALFCQHFLKTHAIIYTENAFFTPEGCMMDDAPLKADIYAMLEDYASTSVTKKISSIIELLKITAHVDELAPQTDRIHLANGTLFLDGRFTHEKNEIVRSRFPVRYTPDAAPPAVWLHFLDELLYAEDIPCLQEYIGYCLIPSNKGQRMMLIKGSGGEGKSQIGTVLSRLFGCNAKNGSVGKVSENRFARADLEHIHLMIDDDMRMEALKHQGRATLGQVVPKLKYNRSEAVIGEEVGESYKQVQRYIRLTYLIPSILQMVDDGRIAFNPAVEISYMTGEHQTWLKEEMEMCDATPSLVQSRTLKDMSRNGTLTENYLHTLLTEEKPNQRQKFFLNQSDVQQYFPSNYTPQQMQNVIISLLRNWEHKRSSRQRPQREDELER